MPALESGGGGIGGDGGADKILPFLFDGVLLSQKTHGLLLASVQESGHHDYLFTLKKISPFLSLIRIAVSPTFARSI